MDSLEISIVIKLRRKFVSWTEIPDETNRYMKNDSPDDSIAKVELYRR